MKAYIVRAVLVLMLGFAVNASFALIGGERAQAQVGPCGAFPLPPCPPPPPPPSPDPSPSPSSTDTGDHGGRRYKVTTESVILMQGMSLGCSAIVNIVDGVRKARGASARELTPVEAIDNSAMCLFIPAVLVKGINWMLGVKDNRCSREVARRALRENNSIRAREELLWRDGSFERRQAKYLAQYAACYRRR